MKKNKNASNFITQYYETGKGKLKLYVNYH